MTIGSKYIGKKAADSKAIADIMTALLNIENTVDKDKEHFWAIGLSTKLSIKYIELVSLGTLDSALVHPREVFRYAILKGVSSIICAHNHPSGELRPSDNDITITRILKSASDILGIKFIDHIIINDEGEYYSLKDIFGL